MATAFPGPPQPHGDLRIGQWNVDPKLDEISQPGRVVKLEPRTMRLLVYLAEHAGDVVELQQILDHVWPNVVVGSHSAYNAVAHLRRILGDDGDSATYIATVPRKGYRLVAEVSRQLGAREAPAAKSSGPAEPAHAPAPAAEDPLQRSGTQARPARLGVRLTLILGVLLSLVFAGFMAEKLWVSMHAEQSIAVLPFVDLSENKDQEYFSDGLAEELGDALSRVPHLYVAARTSAFSFKGKALDIPSIAGKLHVANVLEGSVRKSGDRLRITAQLIRADNGYHLWSQTFERPLGDIFQVQDEIAGAVVSALKVKLREGLPASGTLTRNADAYNLLLRGRFFGRRSTKADRETAIDLYRQALDLDPNYSLAWSWLALAYGIQAAEGWTSAEAGYARARLAAEHALRLDPQLADAHVAMGYVYEYHDWNWARAQAEYQQALALDPSSVRAWNVNGHLALVTGRVGEAARFYREAILRDPLSPGAHMGMAIALFADGNSTEGESEYRRVAALAPQWRSIHTWLGIAALERGEADSALAEIQQETDEATRLFGLAVAYSRLGRQTMSDRALSDLAAKYPNAWYAIAAAHARRGEADQAFEWLDQAYSHHESGIMSLKGDTAFRMLHDPRYEAMLRKVGLTE
jgi:TolB-like protein/DNA-binding winged helix-turn-helix (wHTH) protein/Tfp pilus assembly protein PilF